MWLCYGHVRTSALGAWFRTEEGSVNPSKFGQLCGMVFYTASRERPQEFLLPFPTSSRSLHVVIPVVVSYK